MSAMGKHNQNLLNEWQRTRTVLARSFYKEMKSNGYSPNQIIELSSELLGLVMSDLRGPTLASASGK